MDPPSSLSSQEKSNQFQVKPGTDITATGQVSKPQMGHVYTHEGAPGVPQTPQNLFAHSTIQAEPNAEPQTSQGILQATQNLSGTHKDQEINYFYNELKKLESKRAIMERLGGNQQTPGLPNLRDESFQKKFPDIIRSGDVAPEKPNIIALFYHLVSLYENLKLSDCRGKVEISGVWAR